MRELHHTLNREARIILRDGLRCAREEALRDAEGFQKILFALERLGCAVSGKIMTLGQYEGCIFKALDIAEPSSQLRAWHTPPRDLFRIVTSARNDALHQGAYARHLTTHAVQLALILEDELMNNQLADLTVSDFMVRHPVCADLWQPLSFVRQRMLENSFTFLPVMLEPRKWHLVSDRQIAHYLRSVPGERKDRLAHTLDGAVKHGMQLEEAVFVPSTTTIDQVIQKFTGNPILVSADADGNQLVGILTAFDLL